MNDFSSENAGLVHGFETGVQPAGVLGAWTRDRTEAGGFVANCILTGLLVLGLAGLVWFSLHLAALRIFQVDECCNIYTAASLAHGGNPGVMDVFQYLLSWLARGTARSIDIFVSARFVMVEIFWLNLVLMAAATGERFLSHRWLMAFLGAATLAPLWDYGFEIRHDNLLLTGMLLSWYLVRARPMTLESCFILGACAIGLEFVASKAFVYTLPLSFAALACPPPGASRPRWKLVAAWLGGALSTVLVMRLLLGAAGVWGDYFKIVQSIPATPGKALRFWPWEITLSRLLLQTPLLLALCAAGAFGVIGDVFRRHKAAINWTGNLPEALLLALAVLLLFINPNPYPYNLLHLVPYAFLFAWRYATALWDDLADQRVWIPAAIALVAFTHLAPFAVATHRHLDYTNYRQERLMHVAEDATDPVSDPVYDAIGMVPTRPIVDPRAFLHGQTLQSMINGPGPQVRDLLAANPPAVIIPNYRTDWLPDADHEFIRKRYVALADDFLVLGRILPSGGGTFEVVHAGRYRISPLSASNLEGTYFVPQNLQEAFAARPEAPVTPLVGTVDDKHLTGQPVELSVGTHELRCSSDCKVAVVWVGPKLNQLPRIAGGDHRELFCNWY